MKAMGYGYHQVPSLSFAACCVVIPARGPHLRKSWRAHFCPCMRRSRVPVVVSAVVILYLVIANFPDGLTVKNASWRTTHHQHHHQHHHHHWSVAGSAMGPHLCHLSLPLAVAVVLIAVAVILLLCHNNPLKHRLCNRGDHHQQPPSRSQGLALFLQHQPPTLPLSPLPEPQSK